MNREGMFYEKSSKGVKCWLCPWECEIEDGALGRCRARRANGDKLIAESYGMVTSICVDPIEKKPLKRFHSGSLVLSVGLYGCNFHCPFCQNHHISMEKAEAHYVSAEDIAMLAEKYAQDNNNVGVAYTYNEPLIAYEYVLDCAKLIHARQLKNVVVSNGCINEEPFKEILPHIDAFNIDLKGSAEFYRDKLGGDLEIVKNNIRLAAEQCHVEVTTLIIPEENDTDEEMEDLARFLSSIRPDIPLHLTRFIPQYKYAHKQPTGIKTMFRLKEVAGRHLQDVSLGNLPQMEKPFDL